MRNPLIIKRLISVLVSCLCTTFIFANQLLPVKTKDVKTEYLIPYNKILVHTDIERDDSIGMVMNIPFGKWSFSKRSDFHKQAWKKGKIWFAFRLQNDSPTDSLNYFLEFGQIDELNIYYELNDELNHQRKGTSSNFNEREILEHDKLRLSLPPNADIIYFAHVNVRAFGVSRFKFKLFSENEFLKNKIIATPNFFYKTALNGFFHGIVLLLLLFTLINYIAQKDKIYFTYFLYLITIFLYYQLSARYDNPSIFGNYLEVASSYSRAIILLSGGLYVFFLRQFLGINRTNHPYLNRALIGTTFLFSLIALLYALMVYSNTDISYQQKLYYTTKDIFFPISVAFAGTALYIFRKDKINWLIIAGSITLILPVYVHLLFGLTNSSNMLRLLEKIQQSQFLSFGQLGVITEITLFYFALTLRSRKLFLEQTDKLNSSKLNIATKEKELADNRLVIANKEKQIADKAAKEAILQKKILQKELKALKSKVNPHFISNALTAINSLIDEDKKQEANLYLSKFSRMMRAILDKPDQSLIPLEEELTFCQLYLELESLRFDHEFDYTINTNNIDTHFIKVPPMILHPYLENAIKHGLRQKKGNKFVKITISYMDTNTIKCAIEDNGVGRKKALELKKESRIVEKSHGIKINNDIISNSNKIYGTGLRVNIIDKNIFKNKTGTIVELEIPI